MIKWNIKACIFIRALAIVFPVLLTSCAYNGLFFPLDSRVPKQLEVAVEHHALKAFDSTLLNISVIKPKIRAKSVLFVLHGSGSTVNNWIHVVQNMRDYGYEVVMMEYRGFAASAGKAEHLKVVEDARRVLIWLNDRYKRQDTPLLVMGQSYGAQIAIHLVSQQPHYTDGLIIEGAFTSFKDIAMSTTPTLARPFTWATFKEPYNGQKLLETVSLPKLIIHSDDDKVVPFFMGESLHRIAPEPKQFMPVSGGHITATRAHAEELDRQIMKLFL